MTLQEKFIFVRTITVSSVIDFYNLTSCDRTWWYSLNYKKFQMYSVYGCIRHGGFFLLSFPLFLSDSHTTASTYCGVKYTQVLYVPPIFRFGHFHFYESFHLPPLAFVQWSHTYTQKRRGNQCVKRKKKSTHITFRPIQRAPQQIYNGKAGTSKVSVALECRLQHVWLYQEA